MTYSLMNGPALREEAPYTFFLPHPALIEALRPGDLVKLGFEYDEPGEKYGAERMWVEVEEAGNGEYSGKLISDPAEPILEPGLKVRFSAEHLLDVMLVDQARLPEVEVDRDRIPPFDPPREYWERCMVDDCVLYDGVPVEYLYREEPDLAQEGDKYPDSGWRIRGRQGDASDADMEERSPLYVALGAVLNRDDSWLHLIDAPIGSAFMRDFASGTYQPVRRG